MSALFSALALAAPTVHGPGAPDANALAAALHTRGVDVAAVRADVNCNSEACAVRVGGRGGGFTDSVPIAGLSGDDVVRAVALTIATGVDEPAEGSRWGVTAAAGVGGSVPRAVIDLTVDRRLGHLGLGVGPSLVLATNPPRLDAPFPSPFGCDCTAVAPPPSALGVRNTLGVRIGGRWAIDLGVSGRLAAGATAVSYGTGRYTSGTRLLADGGPQVALVTPHGLGVRAAIAIPAYRAPLDGTLIPVPVTSEVAVIWRFGG